MSTEATITPGLQYKISMLPDSPGCYLMKSQGQIIYVGKAVNLKNRVRSYFHGSHTPKVAAMLHRVDDFDLVLCQSNLEALTLECNLIKKHRPYYNILLKDDKHYPYLRIHFGEPFPRLTLARRMDSKDGARYFGPYLGANQVKEVLDEVRRFFPLRTCKMKLPASGYHRPCIQHQIGRCMAPCMGKVTEEEYREVLRQVVSFLSGDTKAVISDLKKAMADAAMRMEYEQAALYRDKIRDIEAFGQTQHAIQTRDVEQDVIAVAADEQDALIYLSHIRSGRMEEGISFVMQHTDDEPMDEIIASFITQYYEDESLIPRNVLAETLPEPITAYENYLRIQKGSAVTLTVPQRGEKHDLILLAKKNAEDALMKHKQSAVIKDMRTRQALIELQEALSLPTPPLRIEGYDISNTQGLLSVASMVVFQNAEPDKKSYRIFRIKTVEGANDFASIGEAISRRFTHGLEEKHRRLEQGLDPDEGSFSHLPDLVLIDGGPEQLAFAREAMLNAGADVPMFGLAKKFEEIYLPGQDEPLILDRRSNALHLIQYVRDEAHRFGITHHRALRSKDQLQSRLSEIPGIGPVKQRALIRYFGNVSAIFAASEAELMKVEGIHADLARRILEAGQQNR